MRLYTPSWHAPRTRRHTSGPEGPTVYSVCVWGGEGGMYEGGMYEEGGGGRGGGMYEEGGREMMETDDFMHHLG